MSTSRTLRFPSGERPRVSVLMVTYGARAWVERALEALSAHTPGGFELIIVDNGSTDGTREFLHNALEGVRVHTARRNLGFGTGNNFAALHARGEFLCFLNSDAVVPEHWLDPLLARFDDARVGAVVPLYVSTDGTLQEAGSVVEPDGRVVALGVRQDPELPSWRFRRTVTYGSAACMLMRRRVFDALGGFDPAYGLAYYEDVDLAFRMATIGLRVVVEPAVRVVHAQGASSPTAEEAATLRDTNQQLFCRRWVNGLRHRPRMFGRPEPHRFFAARDVEVVDRVLVVASAVASPADSLGRCAIALAAALDCGLVTVVVGQDDPAREAFLSQGIEVVVVKSWDAWLAERQFHYAVVVVEPSMQSALSGSLATTQPQAAITAPPPDALLHGPGGLGSWLLDLGVVPRTGH
jgi:O-antigen biosynthesis protein